MTGKTAVALFLAALPAIHLAWAAGIGADDQARLLRLLRHDCGSCHGMTLQGGLGPSLLPRDLEGMSPGSLVQTILDGRPGTPMPPWKGLLSEAEARWLAGTLKEGAPLPGKGGRGLVVERATGRVLVVDTGTRSRLAEVGGLGDLSHATVVYSPDGRYGYVFGRDGGLTKVDLSRGQIVRRVMQAGNSIGGAISRDGRLVAVSNYKPGGVRVFDAGTLDLLADIPALYDDGAARSRVVGLVDAPGRRFVFSLFDAGEIWVADLSEPRRPRLRKYPGAGRQPYDALITPDGRYYIAGLFGEDGLALLDLRHPEDGVRRILDGYGRGERALPVYKMPHLEGWAVAGGYAFIPAVGRHEVLVVERRGWREVARIPVHGQPVFVMARPDGRQVWVNFAHPDNDAVQVIDVAALEVVKTLRPGRAVLHMEFVPGGREVWLSARDDDRVVILDTREFRRLGEIPAESPSGIFFTARADKIGL